MDDGLAGRTRHGGGGELNPVTATALGGPSGSTLAAGGGDAAHEGFLSEEEEDHHRQDRDQARGHELVPLHAAVLALEFLQGEREGESRFAGQVEQGAEKVVPSVEKVKQRRHREHRPAERQDDAPEDAPFARAVDPRRLA